MTMTNFKVITLSLALIISSFSMAEGKLSKSYTGGNWEKLGTKTVNMKADHDVLTVSFHEGFYTKVKFVIRKAPIYLKNVNIVFGNGNNKNIIFNRKFAPNSTTRIIDLPGNKRVIKKIKMNYKSAPTQKGRAVFVIWGKH